jgi:DNA-directed RNA polymerase specialized sigma subunit
MSGTSSPEQEQRLVAAATTGSQDAWHEIVERYSGLIHTMARRYLVGCDEDDERNIYVDVLEALYDGALARFDGRASLSTWIGVVTRSRCMDHLRHQRGRRQDPVWLERLSTADRQVYRQYYIEGLGFSQICESRRGNVRSFSVEQLGQALDRIDAHLDRSSRRRLAFELEARSVAAVSGRLLEFLAYSRQRAEEAAASSRTDLQVLERDTRALLERVEVAVLELETVEQEVVELRYRDGLTAETVATRLGLSNARQVYTISDRAILKLRKIMAL